METFPDTTGYMTAGFVITFLTMGLYVLSVYLRNKNLNQDLETLKSLETEQTKKK